MKQFIVEIKSGEKYAFYHTKTLNKPNLLLIHGNTSSGIFFMPLIDALKDDFNIIVPDLRGFGNSTYNKPIDKFTDFSNDLNELLEALEITHTYVLGWSLGGTVAMDFAINYPNLVDKLILLSSGSVKGYPIFKKDQTGMPMISEIYTNKEDLSKDFVQVVPLLLAQQNNDLNFMEYIYNLTIYTGPNKPNPEDNKLWLTEALKQRNLVDVDWALANFNITNEPSLYSIGSNKLEKLQAPILNLWGAKDVVVPQIMFEENKRFLKNAKHIVYENAGHSLIVDDIVSLVNNIKIFLK